MTDAAITLAPYFESLESTDPLLWTGEITSHEGEFYEVENARLLFNPFNVGFGAACNQGAAHARGRHLLFLNNDVLVAEADLPLDQIEKCLGS